MKVKVKSFKRVLSITLIFMMVLSVFTPLYSSHADARDVVVHTPTQDIDYFTVNMISAIANQGTNEAPQYIITPTDAGCEVRYQLDYSLSGSFDIASEKVSITIPKHIFKDRSGEYADEYELAVPEASEIGTDDTDNEFVYIERGDDILIYNRLGISAADSGSIQFSYRTTKQPYEYIDMSVSDTVTAAIEIKKSEDEVLYTYDTAPAVTVNTYAKLESVEKSISIGPPMSWDSRWGNAADLGIDDPEKYYFLVWTVKTDISATQPYTLTFDDNASGEYGETEFVGIKWDEGAAYSSATASPVRTLGGTSYFYVLTRHLKTVYEPLETYRIYNKINAAVQPFDGVDPVTKQLSSAVYTFFQPIPDYPIGHVNYWKYNNYSYFNDDVIYNSKVMNYQLSEFKDNLISDIHENMIYKLHMVSFSYPWTIEDGYSIEDVDHYGVNKLTYVMTDDIFYFADTVTAYHNYDTLETGYTVPAGTEQLDHNDFDITEVNYDLLIESGVWNTETLKFDTTDPEYKNGDDVYIYAKFGADTEFTLAGIYHLDTKKGDIFSDKVMNLSLGNITFTDDAECVGYRIVISSSYFHIDLKAYPSCRIKHSERIHRLINQTYNRGEKRVWLTNIANVTMYKCEDEQSATYENRIFDKTEYARNYIIGYEKESYIEKKTTYLSNSKLKRTATVGWQVNASEGYMTQYGRVYVPQSSGVFYDLIPEGADVRLSSVSVAAGHKTLKPSQIDVSKITNYKGTGRTMLVVRIKQPTDEGYRLTYSTVHSWESIFDYGELALNSAAYETGNSTIAGGYPDNGGRLTYSSIMRDLDPETNAKKFIYAEASRILDFLLAVNTGLNKKVKSDFYEDYGNEIVVRQGGTYSYRMRYATDFVTKAKNMIFVDNIEQFTDAENNISNQWSGTLQSVDVSSLKDKGIAPVVYLSADTVVIDQQTGVDLEDPAVWTRLEDFGDLSRAKAVAIDMRKAADGSDFILGANDSVLAYLYMKAPSSVPAAELSEGQTALLTHNAVSMCSRLISTVNDNSYSDRVNTWSYDTAELRVMGDLPILKLDATDHTRPAEGISFSLTGTSDYGTEVNSILESDNKGRIVFKDIEKGTYTLKEYQGTPDFFKVDAVMTVNVLADGSVTVDGAAISDAFVIDDPPRIHADIVFNKRDHRYKNKVVQGVRFHLEGTSDYGNPVSVDAVSDIDGVVTFENIEMGSYIMREVSTVHGYFFIDTEFSVRIDENSNFEINGAVMELDGSLSIYNEPLYSFTIQKESTTGVDGVALPVEGAVFNLSGVSDHGTEINETKTTESNGRVTFSDLEAGSYILYEVSAPEGYTVDPTRRPVLLSEDGGVEIEGIEPNSAGNFVIKNNDDSTVVITKKWEDRFTNETRQANPVIRLGIEEDAPVAFFYAPKGASLLTGQLKGYNVNAFAPGDAETAQEKIADGTAYRVDDDSTSYSIYAWLDDDTYYWWSDASKVYLTEEYRYLWYDLRSLTSIDVTGIDISLLTDMSCLFYNCSKLTTLTGADSWDVSKVTNMSNMFYNCDELAELSYISGWDVSHVKDMSYMFNSCDKLADLSPISRWDTSSVTTLSNMFYYCPLLTNSSILNLRSWNTSSVTDMSRVFGNCQKLNDVTVYSEWDKSKVTNMSGLFYLWSTLSNINRLSSWDVSKVTNMNHMFMSCSGLTNLNPISGWNVSNVTDINHMFYGCQRLTNLNALRNWNVSNVTNMEGLLCFCTNINDLTGIKNWDLSSVTSMRIFFGYCYALTNLTPISEWDMSHVTNIEEMFYYCKKLSNIAPISGWDVSNVTNMSDMFNNCIALTSADLSKWKVSSVTNVMYMFISCSKLTSANLSGWNTSNVNLMGGIFEHCVVLTTVDLSGWDTSNATQMWSMFYNCPKLVSIYASNEWSTDSCNSSDGMFTKCTSLNNDGGATRFNSSYTDKTYARIYKPDTPGYLRLKEYTGPTTDPTPTGDHACFKSVSSEAKSILTSVTAAGNIEKFMHYTGDDAAEVIASMNAVRLDDEKTEHAVYGWMDNGTLYWWSDADTVYLVQGALWRELSSCTYIDVSGIDISRMTDMSYMFYECSALTTLKGISGWDVSKVTDMHHMFAGCSQLPDLSPVSGWDVSNVVYMHSLFRNCSQITDLNALCDWDVSNVTYMSYMFLGCSQLNDLSGISEWDVSKVTTMESMFDECTQLTCPDLSGWNTSSLKAVNSMFSGCSQMTSFDLSGWDASNIETISSMFYNCSQLVTADLGSWNIRKVTSPSRMFENCPNLITIDLSGWYTCNFSYTVEMFSGCTNLKTIYVSYLWGNNGISTDPYYSKNMFTGCTSLVGGNGTPFNSSYITKTYARIDTEATPGYLTYKKRSVEPHLLEEVYNSTSPNCELTKLSDTTWTYTFSGLNPTIQYYAWEDEIEGYTSLNMGEANFLTVKDGIGTITNTSEDAPLYGELTVKKNVLNKDGTDELSEADKQRQFLFTVQLTDADGTALTDTLMLDYVKTVSGRRTRGALTFRAGKALFRLGDDDTMKFTAIPEGYKYTVTETAEEGFDTSVENSSGTISSEQPQTVLYTNRKNYDESEDITFTLEKKVTGNYIDPAEQFGFTVYFEGLRANGNYTVKSNKSTDKIFSANASGYALAELSLVDGEIVSFTVPENTAYTITELAGAYKASYEITDSEGLDLINNSAGHNTQENKALSTRRETADAGEKIAVVFTNTKDTRQKLTLLKELQNAPEGTTEHFEFTIDITGLEAGCILETSLGRMIAEDDGSVSTSFDLASGTQFVIENIPVGAVYEITESASAYTASCAAKKNGTTTLYTKSNSKPEKALSTGKRTIQGGEDHEVVFTNRKISCDVTITKIVDMTYGLLTEREYSAQEFGFDIILKGLGSLKYNEIMVEYTKKGAVGSVRRSLAEVMNMTEQAGQQQVPQTVSFTVALHHNDSLRIRNLPYNASCMITEQAAENYTAAYTVTANEGAVLQAEPRSNSRQNTALALSAEEKIDTADKDIEFVFTNKYDLRPYALPAAGTDDVRPMLAIAFSGILMFAVVYYAVSRRRRSQD